MTDAAIEQRDEQVAEAITIGQSLRAVRREFALSVAELDAVLEKIWPIDTAARLRMIKTDLGKLDHLIEVFYQKAIAGDVNSGVLTVKAWERKAELLGLDAVQRIDLQLINPPQQVSRHEKIREAIMRLTESRPERSAAIDRIDQLGPAKALELLGSPQPQRLNGGGDGQSGSPPAGVLITVELTSKN